MNCFYSYLLFLIEFIQLKDFCMSIQSNLYVFTMLLFLQLIAYPSIRSGYTLAIPWGSKELQQTLFCSLITNRIIYSLRIQTVFRLFNKFSMKYPPFFLFPWKCIMLCSLVCFILQFRFVSISISLHSSS